MVFPAALPCLSFAFVLLLCLVVVVVVGITFWELQENFALIVTFSCDILATLNERVCVL